MRRRSTVVSKLAPRWSRATAFVADVNIRNGRRLGFRRVVDGGLATFVPSQNPPVQIGVPVTPSWTILMRIRRDVASDYAYFLGMAGATTGEQVSLATYHVAVGGRMLWYDGASRDSGIMLSATKFTNVAISFNSRTNMMSFYADGILTNSVPVTNTNGSVWQFAILPSLLSDVTLALLAFIPEAVADGHARALTADPNRLFTDPVDEEESYFRLAQSGPAKYTIAVSAAAMEIGRGQIAMRASRRVAAQAAQLQLAGADVAIRASRKIGMQPAALSFASGHVDLRAARRVAVSAADMVLERAAAQMRATRRLPVTAVEIALQPGPVQMRAVRRLVVAPVVATLVGGSIEFIYTPVEEGNSYSIPVTPAALAFTGGNVTMRVTRKIAATPATLTLLAGDVRLLAARRLGVGAAALQATAGQVLLRAARCLPAAPAQLLVVGGAVTLRYSSQVEYTRAPVGAGYSPQRVEVQARPAQLGGSRPASTQRNNR